MAYYEGNREDFKKFIDGYTRNLVHSLTAKHKRKRTCSTPDCKKRKGLQAAHLKGHERPEMIRRILEELGENADNNTFKIDLNKFEEKFIEAHTPYDKAIKILCFECHRKYDNEKEIIPLVDEEVEQDPAYITVEEILTDMEEVKIGQLVRQTFFEKFKSLSDSEIENLIDPKYSKENFNIDYSVLKEYRDDKDTLDEKGKCVTSHQRMWFWKRMTENFY